MNKFGISDESMAAVKVSVSKLADQFLSGEQKPVSLEEAVFFCSYEYCGIYIRAEKEKQNRFFGSGLNVARAIQEEILNCQDIVLTD